MDVMKTLQALSDAVSEAKARRAVVAAAVQTQADTVAKLTAALESGRANTQAAVDTAQAAYDEARGVAERLQAQLRDSIGDLLPAADPRVRMS